VRNLVLAYIDPGAGAVALQLLLAGVAGLAIAARMLARRLRDRILKRTTKPPAPGKTE
jgi:hypothetical protein